MQTGVLRVERQVSERESPLGPWLRRADRPGCPVCGRPGVPERGEGAGRGPGAPLVTHRDGARVFQKACVRPTAPARQGAPVAAPCPGPRFSHSPPHLPPQTGATALVSAAPKCLTTPPFPLPPTLPTLLIHEDLLTIHSRRLAGTPESLASNLGECPRRVCSRMQISVRGGPRVSVAREGGCRK